ncbi:MAG: TetR family transcriptional regulator [Anaerolineales bacterium]|nr:TetR family transcriptional regulator [Anaerolineales bacterium]
MNNTPEKRKARQDDVYTAAAKLFAQKGYHATRMQDIADELGLLKGSLYYYFSSKEELLLNLTQGHIEEAITAVSGILATGYTPTEKLTLAIDEHLRLYQEHAHIYAIFMQENLRLINRDTAVQVDTLTKQYEQLWAQILRAGVDAREFAPDLDIEVTVKAILSMCNNTINWYNPHGRVPIRELARIFANLILKGVTSNEQ